MYFPVFINIKFQSIITTASIDITSQVLTTLMLVMYVHVAETQPVAKIRTCLVSTMTG